jgi:hypothetical protein
MVIGFFDEDYTGILLPHIDALVVTLTVVNHNIHRIFVDNRSLANILFGPHLRSFRTWGRRGLS